MSDGSRRQLEKKVRAYLAAIGRRGGLASRRELSRSHAKQMVAIREAKRAALKEGKPLHRINRKRLTMHKDKSRSLHAPPAARKNSFPSYARAARHHKPLTMQTRKN